MATQPDKEPKEPLQPGKTQPQPTHFPGQQEQGTPPYSPDPLVAPED